MSNGEPHSELLRGLNELINVPSKQRIFGMLSK